MVVVGIDLGAESIRVAKVDVGHPGVLINERGDRYLPSVIAFDGKTKLFGHQAMQHAAWSPCDAITEAKFLLSESAVSVEQEKKARCRWSLNNSSHKDGKLTFNIDFDCKSILSFACRFTYIFVSITAATDAFRSADGNAGEHQGVCRVYDAINDRTRMHHGADVFHATPAASGPLGRRNCAATECDAVE